MRRFKTSETDRQLDLQMRKWLDADHWRPYASNPHAFYVANAEGRRDGVDGTRKTTDLLVCHWTGGESPVDRLVANMRKRKTRDGRGLSVQFYIDASGVVWQLAPIDAICRHAAGYNVRAVGVEIQNRGLARQEYAGPRGIFRHVIHGKEVRTLAFNSLQMASWVALARVVCRVYKLPRVIPSHMYPFDKAEASRFSGVCGHLHLSRRKLDPGPQPFDELADEGFALAD